MNSIEAESELVIGLRATVAGGAWKCCKRLNYWRSQRDRENSNRSARRKNRD
jgi:hypothetical protein